jgi:hypothetical protein
LSPSTEGIEAITDSSGQEVLKTEGFQIGSVKEAFLHLYKSCGMREATIGPGNGLFVLLLRSEWPRTNRRRNRRPRSIHFDHPYTGNAAWN